MTEPEHFDDVELGVVPPRPPRLDRWSDPNHDAVRDVENIAASEGYPFHVRTPAYLVDYARDRAHVDAQAAALGIDPVTFRANVDGYARTTHHSTEEIEAQLLDMAKRLAATSGGTRVAMTKMTQAMRDFGQAAAEHVAAPILTAIDNRRRGLAAQRSTYGPKHRRRR